MEDVKNKGEKKEVLNKLVKVFWVFIIGSVIGYVLEMIVGLVQNGHFVSRQGLLIGPFIQVYGLGLVTYYLVISKIKDKNNVKIFILSMILGGVIDKPRPAGVCRRPPGGGGGGGGRPRLEMPGG